MRRASGSAVDNDEALDAFDEDASLEFPLRGMRHFDSISSDASDRSARSALGHLGNDIMMAVINRQNSRRISEHLNDRGELKHVVDRPRKESRRGSVVRSCSRR